MKVYLAARWSRREELDGYARELDDLDVGLDVCSRWHSDPSHRITERDGVTARELNERLAAEDFTDLFMADVLVYFSPGGLRSGCHVEVGMALGRGQKVALVGERENVFHWLPQVNKYADWASCREDLLALAGRTEASA